MAYQPDIVVVDKLRKMVVVIDVAVPNDSNFRKYQGLKEELKEELKKMWKLKVAEVPEIIEALSAVSPKLGE